LIKKPYRGDRALPWLRSISGIGDFFCDTGLILFTSASGNKVHRSRITEKGNKYLK
jgi:hypothetical protein